MFPVSAAAVIRELGTRRGGGGGEYRSQELSLGHRGEAELTSLDLADLLSSTLPPSVFISYPSVLCNVCTRGCDNVYTFHLRKELRYTFVIRT